MAGFPLENFFGQLWNVSICTGMSQQGTFNVGSRPLPSRGRSIGLAKLNDSTSITQRWASRRWILERYSLPIRKFEEAVGNGVVRSVKFSESRQGARVFLISDVEKLMLALAAGRKPSRMV